MRNVVIHGCNNSDPIPVNLFLMYSYLAKTIWKIFRKFSFYIEFISFTFILLFIWEQTEILLPLLFFAIVYSLSAILGAFVSVYITNGISPKIALLTGFLIQTIQLVLFITLNSNLTNGFILLIGISGGLAAGLKVIAEYTYERSYEDRENILQIQSARIFWIELIKLVTIGGSAFLVYFNRGYETLFDIILISSLLGSFTVLFLHNNYLRRKTEIKKLLTFPGTNPEKSLIAKSELFEGMYDGINTVILPVALLYFVGNFMDWGIVNILLLGFSLCVSIIAYELTGQNSYKSIYAISTVLFAGISIFTIFEYNIYVLLAYMVTMVTLEVSGSIGYNTTIENIIDLDQEKDNLIPEYKFLIELSSNIGKFIPLTLLMLLDIDLSEEFTLKMALIIGSTLPIIIISMFGKSLIFRSEEN